MKKNILFAAILFVIWLQSFSQTQSNVSYGTDAKQKLDYYSASVPNSPIIIIVHGGGWFAGDKNGPDYQNASQLFNNEGYAVVNINYRLTANPNPVTYPSHIEDLACALAWTKNNASSMNGDSSRVAMYGHSAGGQMTAYLGVRPINPMLAGCSNSSGLNVDGVLLTSATVDFDLTDPSGWTPINNMLGDSTQYWNIAQPTHQTGNNFGTKFLILCGEFDNLGIEQDSAFHDSLQSYGRCSVLRMFSGYDHFTMISSLTASNPVFNAMTDFLDSLWQNTLCLPTGISPANDTNDFSIYPNPSNGQFIVYGLPFPMQIQIYNSLGEKAHEECPRPKGSKEINITLPSGSGQGIYFYRILAENIPVSSGKIIVE